MVLTIATGSAGELGVRLGLRSPRDRRDQETREDARRPGKLEFDRAAPSMSVVDVRELSLTDPAVTEAAEFLGLAPT